MQDHRDAVTLFDVFPFVLELLGLHQFLKYNHKHTQWTVCFPSETYLYIKRATQIIIHMGESITVSFQSAEYHASKGVGPKQFVSQIRIRFKESAKGNTKEGLVSSLSIAAAWGPKAREARKGPIPLILRHKF